MTNPTHRTSSIGWKDEVLVNCIQWIGFNVIMSLLPFGFIFLLASMKDNSRLSSFNDFYILVSPNGELSIASIALLSDVTGDLLSTNHSSRGFYIVFQKVLGTAAIIALVSLASIYGCVAAVNYLNLTEILTNKEDLINLDPALNLLNQSYLTIFLICLLGKIFVWVTK